ncbi:MAG: peptidylprolyl isomerase [Bryobacteraceae bacterium]|jgi:parvulin-like peptidyl-prolyl isomerase
MKFSVVAVLLVAAGAPAFAAVEVVEQIIAKVNGDIITNGDLERTAREARADLVRQGAPAAKVQEMMAEHAQDQLRNKIDQLLLIQKAKDLDIKVDNDVSKYLANLQKQVGEADTDKFHEMIHQQTGESFEDFKADVSNNMLTEHVIRQEVQGHMTMDHKEIEAYYNAHKTDFVREEKIFLREILISTENKDASTVAAAQKKADDLVKRARGGERFAEMAHENSDAVTREQYGDLGGWKKGELADNIEKAVWAQPAGYITDPIKVQKGLLILKVESHQKAGQATLDEAEPEIMDKLYQPKMQPALRAYLTKLRESAFLEIKKGYIDSGAAPGKDTAWMDAAQLKPETVTKAEAATRKRRKHLLGVPLPGTTSSGTSSSSTSSKK